VPEISKTNTPCDCGWIAQALNTKDSGIILEPTLNMFCFSSPNGVFLVLWHCPQCGGTFPDPGKPFWAPILTDSERSRLEGLIKDVADVTELFNRMGKPDYDVALTDGTRNIEFYNLSQLANVECYVSEGRKPECRLSIKPLSARPLDLRHGA
jgi:hypothetical protein